MTIIAWIFAIILILIFCGVGIGASFLGASMLHQVLTDGSIVNFTSAAFDSHNSYALLAVPLFTLGGLLMEKSGIADRIIDWCEFVLKKVKGGLGAVIPLASMLFGTLTGSALSTVNTVGNMMTDKCTPSGGTNAILRCCAAYPRRWAL